MEYGRYIPKMNLNLLLGPSPNVKLCLMRYAACILHTPQSIVYTNSHMYHVHAANYIVLTGTHCFKQ